MISSIKIAWNCIFILAGFLTHAQSAFNKGDQFQKETFSNTNCLIKHAGSNIKIEIGTFVSQLYSLENISQDGYIFKVTTKKISDSIKSFGEKAYYNSEWLKDTSSVIEKAIKNVLDQTSLVLVDKKGIILSVKTDPIEYTSDSLLKILGFSPNSFILGSSIGFITNYNFNSLEGNRFSNMDSSTINDNKTVTSYHINSQTDSITSVIFNQNFQGRSISTNTNGVLLVNNATGMVMEKATKSVTRENLVFNNTKFFIIRNTASSEVFTKLYK